MFKMPKGRLFIVSYIFVLFLVEVKSFLEYDSWMNIELSHALNPSDPNDFTFRGNISIPSLNVGTALINQKPLTTREKENLKLLADLNNFYRLRATITYSDGSIFKFLTSSKSSSLLASQLSDILWISVDSSGSVLALTQTISWNGYQKEANSLDRFSTDVLVKHIELAPVPDTTSFIQKLEREREARERGETRDNRGFFAKYWMYIVPVALLVLISGATNPEANSGGGR